MAAAPEEPLKATGGEFWQQVRRVCDLHLLSLPVDPAAALDEAALLRYLAADVPAFSGPTPALSLTQFEHGQSNPTYCIHASASAPGEGGGQALRAQEEAQFVYTYWITDVLRMSREWIG